MKAKEFGERLRGALHGAGFSKLHFARELQSRRGVRQARGGTPLRKVDRPALYAFLEGRDVPPIDTLSEMAEILDVRLGWLAEGEEPLERDLEDYPTPIWLVDGHRGAWRRPSVAKRREARSVFQELFLARSGGFQEAEPVVKAVFQELLSARLARRRSRGDRGPSDPSYRAETARGLYLKCFLDLKAELPKGTEFSSPVFTAAFLGKVGGWFADEER
jgi:transcriptional regulator with XRE-family HTH domain